MRALVDRHHAGLFYSLQLLFSRLGVQVYTPVGYDWWHEGYWAFGREAYGDTRLADQYLSTADASWSKWTDPRDGVWTTHDHEYPGREILGVELAAARHMDWDFVVATVQDNQRGFKRFAVEQGARYVYQVGNTGQQVDWSLDPLAIVSSEAPIIGRGVRYLQEMHPAYHWSAPTNPLVVRSFVNAAPQLPCWPTTLALWGETNDDFTWELFGSGLPVGTLFPTTEIAAYMASAGWGHHDKTHGDGFGHVLWGWAAVGRPVIGHASHYAGKLGEVLWQDLVTCIDLDRHTVPEVARLMRDIASDTDAHMAMCLAMRETFDRYYDPDRDAENIARLLGVWA